MNIKKNIVCPGCGRIGKIRGRIRTNDFVCEYCGTVWLKEQAQNTQTKEETK